jgi:CRP/FNR family transcriptional regulator, dissimilatory nitrate respiration regulator
MNEEGIMNQDIELFKELTSEEMEKLYDISNLRKYQKGNLLFFEGDEPKNLFLLLDGIVKVYKADPKGNEIILHFFQPQTLIAEAAHMERIPYPASAVCETDFLIFEIDYLRFEQDFLRNPDISLKIINSLSKKVKALQNVIGANLTMDTFGRLCKFLYENENHVGEISHRKIATILNVTPETLSINLSVLKKEGIVSVEKRKIVIHEKERLSSYC